MSSDSYWERVAAGVVVGGLEGTVLTKDESIFIEALQPAGYTFFRRNLNEQVEDGVKDLHAHLQRLQQNPHTPFLICVDQEGGRVSRLRGKVTDYGPPLFAFPHADGFESWFQYGKKLGYELKQLGFNINFAPVLDLADFDHLSGCIGDRALSKDPNSIATYAKAFINGHKVFGIATCIKHFPGHTCLKGDTHEAPQYAQKNASDFISSDLMPFFDTINDAPMMMVAHGIYPFFDDAPASQSKSIISWLGRSVMGFEGVIVSDDMNMKAIDQSHYGDAVIQSVLAGVDLLLVCQGLEKWHQTIKTLAAEAESSKIFGMRLIAAKNKVDKLRLQIGKERF